MTKIFLTGITGLVGSAFVCDLLRERDDYEVVTLTRKSPVQSAEERVKEIIRDQCEFDGHSESVDNILSRVKTIEGDVTHIDAEKMAKSELLSGTDIIFHCAADVNLGKDPEGITFNINYNGTASMIELAKKLKVKEFHYVSTAYIAGKLVGRAMEDTPVDSGFNNPYEESKFKSEALVRNCGIPFSVYRPAIITGRLTDGRIRKPLAFYRILEFVGKVKKHYCTKNGLDPSKYTDLCTRFEAYSAPKTYFVPIDFVQQSIVKIFQQGTKNKVYHITGSNPPSTQQIGDAIASVLKIKTLEVLEVVPNPTKEEKLINRMLGDLLTYYSTRIEFDQTNVREALGDEMLSWRVGKAELEGLMKAYFRDFFPNVEWLQKL